MVFSREGAGPFVPLTGRQTIPSMSRRIVCVRGMCIVLRLFLEEAYRTTNIESSSIQNQIENLPQGRLSAGLVDAGDMDTHYLDLPREENLLGVGTGLDYLGCCDRPLGGAFEPACQCRSGIFSYVVLEFGDFFVVGVVCLSPKSTC